jgi:hypothetical protein
MNDFYYDILHRVGQDPFGEGSFEVQDRGGPFDTPEQAYAAALNDSSIDYADRIEIWVRMACIEKTWPEKLV